MNQLIDTPPALENIPHLVTREPDGKRSYLVAFDPTWVNEHGHLTGLYDLLASSTDHSLIVHGVVPTTRKTFVPASRTGQPFRFHFETTKGVLPTLIQQHNEEVFFLGPNAVTVMDAKEDRMLRTYGKFSFPGGGARWLETGRREVTVTVYPATAIPHCRRHVWLALYRLISKALAQQTPGDRRGTLDDRLSAMLANTHLLTLHQPPRPSEDQAVKEPVVEPMSPIHPLEQELYRSLSTRSPTTLTAAEMDDILTVCRQVYGEETRPKRPRDHLRLID